MSEVAKRAVVQGAGMAGLFAARVLSEFYGSVTVVERDRLGDSPCGRQGVPQDRHLHNFLGRGTQILEELFPGLLGELAVAGAVIVADGDLSRTYVRTGRYEMKHSGRLADPSALTLCLASRPFVEFYVRQRVLALPGVAVLDGHDVVDPVVVGAAVSGVRIVHRANRTATLLQADLVVDATGRSARTPALLDSLGYGRPTEKRCVTALGYSSQRFRNPLDRSVPQLVAVNVGSRQPGALMMACEHGTWMLAVGRPDALGSAPPDFATMQHVAAQVLPSSIADWLRHAEPVGETAVFRNPPALWRRYDQMAAFPQGLLVVGDGLCSLNPVYGQGMTMAALHAGALRQSLQDGDHDLATRFFAAAASDIGPTWRRNQANDSISSPNGKRTIRQRLLDTTIKATMIAAAYDTTVTERLWRISHLLDSPTALNDRALLLHVLIGNLRHQLARTVNRAH